MRAFNAADLDYTLAMLLEVGRESMQEFVREFVLDAASAPLPGLFWPPAFTNDPMCFSLNYYHRQLVCSGT
jgi:hypothetical protein